MEEQKKAEAAKESAGAGGESEIVLDNLPKKLTEEEAKNVSGGKRAL